MQTLICDDDAIFSVSCKNRLLLLAQKHRMPMDVKVFDTGSQLLFEAEEFIEKTDLIYLDINMPGENGLITARKLRKDGYTGDIVFLTVDKRFVFDAFDVDAMHYLLKTNTDEVRFEEVFLKAAKRASRRNAETMLFSCGGEQRRVLVSDITYFEVKNRIITVHYGDGEAFAFYSQLSRIEEALFGKGFLRVYTSCLVAESAIRKVLSTGVRLYSGEMLPVSRSFYAKYKTDHAGGGIRQSTT